MEFVLRFLGACLAASTACGQVYLIQATPTPKHVRGGYAASLLQLGADGTVTRRGTILPGGPNEGGTEWIGVSYDARKAVFLSRSPGHTIAVVDFDSAAVVKTCEPPAAPSGMSEYPFEEWLADIPGRGLTYVEHLATFPVRTAEDLAKMKTLPREMLVDPAVPCGGSFPESNNQDTKFLVTSGEDGVPGLGSDNRMYVRVEMTGALSRVFSSEERSYFDYRVPGDVVLGMTNPTAQVMISNREVFGAALWDLSGSNGPVRLMLFRKSDNTWHELTGEADAFVRGFGSFVALTEQTKRSPQTPESAGRAEWRRTETATGPSLEQHFKELPYVLPGRLHLYDVATAKMYNIDTNQGDSEILLVDNGTVYYRVSDRLYSAVIGGESLEPAKLLAQSDSIRDVHWAFVKH